MRHAVAAVAVVMLAARAAAAEHMDVGTSMGRGEVWTAPGLVDVRVSVMRIGLYGNDDARRGTVVDLVTWEGVGDGDGVEHPRDLGERSAAHVIGVRRQLDRDGWGAYIAGDAFTRWFGHNRILTPRVGVRLGRFDRAAAVVEARLPGAYLVAVNDGPQRSVVHDVDVGARTSYVLTRRLRMESRARLRDLRGTDGRQLRDLFLSAGLEAEVSPPGPVKGPNTWRVMTLYAGVGLRRALSDVIPTDDMAPPTLGRPLPSPPAAPWQLMFTVDLDFAINSQLWIW
ncbi:MAG TPA: hypothetical protein VM261_22985 [Kofleriaceae bacterium]|nr:hypothetical protein [Kofleriaceae bacterium]